MKKFLILLTILPFLSFAALDVDPIASRCHKTPNITSDIAKPKNFRSSNDLTREAGSFEFGEGEQIIIIARIMDAKCVPFLGIPIKIWQADSLGKVSNPLMNGTVISDSFGRFHFLTFMPSTMAKNQTNHQYISLQVADNAKTYNFMFFFDDHLNNTNKFIGKLSATDKASVIMPHSEIDGKKYYFLDLVLSTSQQFKSF